MYQRYVKVKGTARERGYQFGVQMKEQIITNYINQTEYYKNKEQFDYKKWEKMAERYVPMIEKWAPEVLEEMRGLAEGAEMEFDQILALTTAYEIICKRSGERQMYSVFGGTMCNKRRQSNCRPDK